MHIARPKFERSILRLTGGKTLTIERCGSGDYPHSASIDTEPCERLKLSVSRMMQGGILTVVC